MTSPQSKGLPVEQLQRTNRLHEIQETLDTHTGRLDRIEANQARQNQKLEAILDQLRSSSTQ